MVSELQAQRRLSRDYWTMKMNGNLEEAETDLMRETRPGQIESGILQDRTGTVNLGRALVHCLVLCGRGRGYRGGAGGAKSVGEGQMV